MVYTSGLHNQILPLCRWQQHFPRKDANCWTSWQWVRLLEITMKLPKLWFQAAKMILQEMAEHPSIFMGNLRTVKLNLFPKHCLLFWLWLFYRLFIKNDGIITNPTLTISQLLLFLFFIFCKQSYKLTGSRLRNQFYWGLALPVHLRDIIYFKKKTGKRESVALFN